MEVEPGSGGSIGYRRFLGQKWSEWIGSDSMNHPILGIPNFDPSFNPSFCVSFFLDVWVVRYNQRSPLGGFPALWSLWSWCLDDFFSLHTFHLQIQCLFKSYWTTMLEIHIQINPIEDYWTNYWLMDGFPMWFLHGSQDHSGRRWNSGAVGVFFVFFWVKATAMSCNVCACVSLYIYITYTDMIYIYTWYMNITYILIMWTLSYRVYMNKPKCSKSKRRC